MTYYFVIHSSYIRLMKQQDHNKSSGENHKILINSTDSLQ